MEEPFSSIYLSPYDNEEYASRSYIEMPQTGEINYISTIVGVRGNPIYKRLEDDSGYFNFLQKYCCGCHYKGKGIWIAKPEKTNFSTVKVDKDDIRAKRHYVKTLVKDGREVKIWECGLCGKEFRFQYTLVRHIPTHTDVRNYQCDICPKAFRQLSTLAQHKATHLNMRPFLCDFCKKSFNRISTLISHKKIHYDEKRHICPFCGKGFHQKGNLRNHMYTHTNERPYKCEVCNKGFNQKSNLVCHKISTHSKKYLYQCELCGSNFGKQTLYISHMETAHNIIVKFSKSSASTDPGSHVQEAQCTLVDESNNVIYHLPISQETKLPNTSNVSKPDISTAADSSSQDSEKNQEDEILSIIKHEPTESMIQLNESGKIPFVLLYQPGETQPKICKAIINQNEYALVHPSSNDIAKYFMKNNNAVSNKFPIVSTVIQKKDSNGKIQTLLLPAGSQPQIVECCEDANGLNVLHYYHSKNNPNGIMSENKKVDCENYKPTPFVFQNKNGRTAVVYTKTQPSVRQTKGRVAFEPMSQAKGNCSIQIIDDGTDVLSSTTLLEDNKVMLELQNKNHTNTPFEYIYLPDSDMSNTSDTSLPGSSSKEGLFEKENWQYSNCNKALPIVYLTDENEIVGNSFNTSNSINERPKTSSNELMDSCDNKNLKPAVSIEVELPNENQVTLIKNEIESSETQDGSCSDIEPSLFSSLDSLKESFSKYNIDFDSDGFDLFDDCSFATSLLDTVQNNATEEIKPLNSLQLVNETDMALKQETNMYLFNLV